MGLAPNTSPAEVPLEVIHNIVWLYGAAIVLLGLVAAYWLGRFPIGREEHEARLKALDIAARGDIDGGTIVP